MAKTHERFQWMAEIMEIRPDDRVLEIGCGVGLGIEAIAQHLVTGKIVAIDRSKKMIDAAIGRNADAIREHKVECICSDLINFKNTGSSFNKVCCFNINFFWTQTDISNETEALHNLLSKNANLYIFYGPLLTNNFEPTKQRIISRLSERKFRYASYIHNKEINCCCIKMTVQ